MPSKQRNKNDLSTTNYDTTATRSGLRRFSPDPTEGLRNDQVRERIQQHLNNENIGVKTKTEGQIIRENIFTFFNILNFLLALSVILVGSYRDALFLGLIFWNILIGSVQGIRSKRTIDKLSLISSPKALVVRDSSKRTINVDQIVLDDIIIFTAGNQVSSDSIVMQGECEVNESLITGESDPITKSIGDELLSGSFIVSGNCLAKVEHVGVENYANKITGDAKYVKKRNSEIMSSIDIIVKAIGFALVPVGLLLFWKQFFILGAKIHAAVPNTVAALIGMIPEGLVLLTSVVFTVSIIKLAMKKTLTQDLYCVETLARVDTLCLDKTGTITEGTMQVDELVPLGGFNESDMKKSLSALVTNLTDDNPTFMAVREYFPKDSKMRATNLIPFSSSRKWSGAYFANQGSFLMGAGEFILGKDFFQIKEKVDFYSAKGQRVLLLAHSSNPFSEKEVPAGISCIGLIVISDKIRREARRTLRYFADQGVDLKVISGDNAITVANIAKKAGLSSADQYVDATTLETEEDIREAIHKYSVFGRVTPQQKLAFVKALKSDGHTVAMTGDGVNDVLALKEADCSIAMASGSDAARTVSSLVLLDSNFASMPLIVKEGRRSINNLQRSASLFLSKTIFSALIGILFIFLNYTYPFRPIQLTLISTLTIGLPSFILALEPNNDRLKGRFISNVLKQSLPAGITMAINIVILCALGGTFGLTSPQMSTVAVIVTSFTGFLMLFKVCSPFNGLRGFLFVSMLTSFVVIAFFFSELFFLVPFTMPMLMVMGLIFMFAIALMITMFHFVDNVITRHQTNLSMIAKNTLPKPQKSKAAKQRGTRHAR